MWLAIESNADKIFRNIEQAIDSVFDIK